MPPLKVGQQGTEEPRKAAMSHFILLVLTAGDTAQSSTPWRAPILHRSEALATEKWPDQQGAPGIYHIKAHELEEVNMQ